jgi:polyisoprenoid-binding protein YceI
MSTTQTTAPSLPTRATFRLDPAATELTFSTWALFGLMRVHGSFGTVSGTLSTDATGAGTGELRVDVSTIDTHIAKRDAHLKREDFFHAEAHPDMTFALTELLPTGGDAHTASGTLRIRDRSIAIVAPATVEVAGDGTVRVRTDLPVDHHAAGLGWSKPLLMSRRAHVRASLVFVRETGA